MRFRLGTSLVLLIALFWWPRPKAPTLSMADKTYCEMSLEEYKSLRQQISDHIKMMDQLEVYAVGAIAAIYVFAVTNGKSDLILAIVPILIAFLGLLRALAIHKTIQTMDGYLESVERDSRNRIGWTRYYFAKSSVCMRFSRFSTWWLLLGLTAVVPFTGLLRSRKCLFELFCSA